MLKTVLTFVVAWVVAALVMVGLAIWSEFRTARTSDFNDEDLYSAVLDEDVRLHVRLPWDYDASANRRYPVIIKMDGDARLDWHDSVLQTMAALDMGDAIVVGVSNGRGMRNRNLTPTDWPQELEAATPVGQGDLFLDFIESELLPWVTANYRASDETVLMGFSRGGLLVLYALATRPEPFDGFVALSPSAWREDQQIVALLNDAADRTALESVPIFLSIGIDETEHMRAAFAAVVGSVRDWPTGTLEIDVVEVPDGTHQTSPYLSIPQAYQHVFSSMGEKD